MRFVVKAYNNGAKARTGTLYLDRQSTSLDTPCLLLATRKGLPHFITPDLLHSLSPPARALQFTPLHFWECPSRSTVVALGGIHEMLSMPEYGFIAILRDSVTCTSDAEGSNKFGASFESPFGRRMVKPERYMESISALKPDLWSSLPDEVPAWVSDKRNKLSVDRTTRWLDECLALRPMDAETALGPIVGGTNLKERIRSAQDVASRNVSAFKCPVGTGLSAQKQGAEFLGIYGFWLGGFGLGESVEQRPALLDAVMGILPEDKPRSISGLGLPEEVLQGVAAGVDLFDSTYPYLLTLGGYAMTFPLSMDDEAFVRKESHAELSDRGADSSKINLRATIYRNDTSPLTGRCICYTCQKHTKAYVNHLLNTHEMLAQTLLDIHNTHHYLEFFQAIRDAINGNYFHAFHSWFVKHRREHIIPACVNL